jgi:Peptidase family C25
MRSIAVVSVAAITALLSPAAAGEKPSRPATVLLVTADSLKAAWKPFADWKTRLGKSTRIVTVGEISKQYKGKDIQQKIRACVLEHAGKHGTKWVVLGGDSLPGGKGLVPDRDTKHVLYGRAKVPDIPTDLYYISPKSWDADGDGVYGEWKDDAAEIAYTGKACIGRVPVRSAADVAAYTRKVIGYETRYPAKNFAKKFLYTCAVSFANYKADMYWEKYLAPKWPGGKCQRFFVNKSPWDKKTAGDYDLTAKNWAERINRKTAGKMHMHGHGLLNCWVMEKRTLITRKTVAALKNADAYLVLTTVSCFTGQFDAAKDPCITESMLRQPQAGAVVIVAPSRPGVPIFHKWARDPKDGKTQDGTTRTLTRFWVNGLSKNLTAGEAFAAAKADLAADARKGPGYHWDQCEMVLLGDPTLDLRARDPRYVEVGGPTDVRSGKQVIRIRCAGKPQHISFEGGGGMVKLHGIKGLTVCLWKNDEVYAVARTDADGWVRLSVSPRTPGDMLLTVSGPSVNAYVGKIVVK